MNLMWQIFDKIIIQCLKVETFFFEWFFGYIFNRIERKSEFKTFTSTWEIKKWAKKNSNYVNEQQEKYNKCTLSDFEKKQLDAINWYCGYYHENINGYLIGYGLDDFEVQKKIKLLDDLIEKFYPSENVIVVRRLKNIFFNNNLKKGIFFVEKAFLSTSLDRNYRLNCESIFSPLHKETMLIIEVPSNINAVYIEEAVAVSQRRQENELLIHRNQVIEVIDYVKIFTNRIVHARLHKSSCPNL